MGNADRPIWTVYTRPNGLLRIIFNGIRRLFWKSIACITIISILIVMYIAVHANIIIEPGNSVYQYDANSAYFSIKNNGYFPLWNVRADCIKVENKVRSDIEISRDRVGPYEGMRLKSGDSTSALCLSPFDVIGGSGKIIPSHDTDVIIEITYWYLPFRITSFSEGVSLARFYTRPDSSGVLKWFPKSLYE